MAPAQAQNNSTRSVPQWAIDACWYQVFVSRFRNGDPANDRPETFAWTTDWLSQPAEAPPKTAHLYGRRYGGDLKGLMEALPYLRDLGVTALYLNPIFAAQTEHKYDPADFRHVDDSFGVAGSLGRVTGETTNPSTWKWSDSDRLFLAFLKQAKAQGMKVVIDGVFNHVGREFWAFQDVMRNGRASAYAGWFEITDFGPPLQWNAWDGPNGHLVQFARTENGLAEEVRDHLFAITRRWMDPDGDGNPADGVDGWRLDAAEKVPHGFWKAWQAHVKSINPDALILGEIWVNPEEWLGGDEFDVVTNYRLARDIVRYCRPGGNGEPFPPTRFAAHLESLATQFDAARTLAMVNVLDSHDTDRAVSMLHNARRRYDRDSQPGAGSPPYDGGLPSPEAYDRLRLAAAMQFTLPGAPMVYYGTEVGMFGADDPYCRAPMWWKDKFAAPPPGYSEDLRRYYQHLAGLRADHDALRRGEFHVLLADDARQLLVYARTREDDRLVIVTNAARQAQRVVLSINRPGAVAVIRGLTELRPADAQDNRSTIGPDGRIEVDCPAIGAVLLSIRRD